ncbi:MAG: hypothetical protein PHD81_03575 [Candidatus Nanoarchaeia archaeon]|nr:hypothetical protein [Candidatus Nanoarchaeia archaeon]MDD5588163.1 hypothetical protein [Candidatus Nanoarchaeia archaeon]
MKKTGEAYGFFDCKASKKEIEAELLNIRKEVKTPSDLELSLIEGVENLKGDSQLMDLAQQAKEEGNNYVLKASSPRWNNEQTSRELLYILNAIYANSSLYQEGEPFSGAIIFKEGDEYKFRE